MKKLCSILISAFLMLLLSLSVAAQSTSLITTNNPDYRLTLQVQEQGVSIEGQLAGVIVLDAYVKTRSSATYINYHADGSFDAFVGFPTNLSDDDYLLCLVLDDSNILYYRLVLENGQWTFPGAELAQSNEALLMEITDQSAVVAASYLAYPLERDATESALAEIQALSDEICADEETDYDRAFAIYYWITHNIYYDFDASEDVVDLETIALANVISTQKTVCAGFANLFAALCEAQGIDSITIKGSVAQPNENVAMLEDSPQNHEFNAVHVDGRWVWVDCTWGTMNAYRNGNYGSGLTTLKYFDISTQALAGDHRADTAERRNYFDSLEYFDMAVAEQVDAAEQLVPAVEAQQAQEQPTSLRIVSILLIVLAVGGIIAATISILTQQDKNRP